MDYFNLNSGLDAVGSRDNTASIEIDKNYPLTCYKLRQVKWISNKACFRIAPLNPGQSSP